MFHKNEGELICNYSLLYRSYYFFAHWSVKYLISQLKDYLNLMLSKAYSEPSQTSKTEIFAKRSIFDVRLGSEYFSTFLLHLIQLSTFKLLVNHIAAGTCLLKVNNGDITIMGKICSKLTILTLFLILNRILRLFCLHCWVWTSRYRAGRYQYTRHNHVFLIYASNSSKKNLFFIGIYAM